jgi:CrcB protein
MNTGSMAACAAVRTLPTRLACLAVFLGGCAGAVARVAIAQAWPTHPGQWPWATLLANLAAAALLGHLVARDPGQGLLASYRRPLLGIGFCGALSTFSTLQLELLEMLDSGRTPLAVLYAVVSLGLGLAVVIVASRLTRGHARGAA